MISYDEILGWLRETHPEKLNELWRQANQTRFEQVGDVVHLRGLIELSSYCRRNCFYCGIRAARTDVPRYRLTMDEALDCAHLAAKFRYGTVVIQAGEDLKIDTGFVTELVTEIKKRWNLAVTLSLGERQESEWLRWKQAGADRYLMRFETSNQALFEAIHPRTTDTHYPNRLELLRILRQMGYEIGSGVMIGIPGQSLADLANDIELFRQLDLDMIGCGPFLAHPATPLGQIHRQNNTWVTPAESSPSSSSASTSQALLSPQTSLSSSSPSSLNSPHSSRFSSFMFPCVEEQAANTNEMAFKVIALARLVCPQANIPSTTAIATIDGKEGRQNGLNRGANVIMPNLTPKNYRALYEIYPHKAATLETAEQTHEMALRQITAIGRIPGTGPGTSPRFSHALRQAAESCPPT